MRSGKTHGFWTLVKEVVSTRLARKLNVGLKNRENFGVLLGIYIGEK